MATDTANKSQRRMAIAITLFLTSITTSFVIAFLSSQGSTYWVVASAIPQGVQLSLDDLQVSKIKLSRATGGYLSTKINPVGAITKRAFVKGELLLSNALTNSSDQLSAESLSLSIRAVDIPSAVMPGDEVSIYQLHDARNGEDALEPRLVISSVFLKSIEGRKGNFSGEISVSISLNRKQIPALLNATTSGRLVIVSAGG